MTTPKNPKRGKKTAAPKQKAKSVPMAKKKKSAKAKSTSAALSAPAEDWDDFVSDLDVINKCAESSGERMVTRENALNRWANVDFVRLARVDAPSCGWAMWKSK